MGYDRGDSFPFDFEPNGIPFGSKSKGKLSPRSYPIQFERKWKYSFLSVETRQPLGVVFPVWRKIPAGSIALCDICPSEWLLSGWHCSGWHIRAATRGSFWWQIAPQHLALYDYSLRLHSLHSGDDIRLPVCVISISRRDFFQECDDMLFLLSFFNSNSSR